MLRGPGPSCLHFHPKTKCDHHHPHTTTSNDIGWGLGARSLQGSQQEEGGGRGNAKEQRRMRRRITNRESAHRMRMKRQEELNVHQRQVCTL